MNLSKLVSNIANDAFLLRNLTFLRLANGVSQNGFSTQASPAQSEKIDQKPQAEVSDLDKLYKTVELELKGNDPAVLNSYAKFATTAAKHFEIESKSWNLRKPKHERFTMYKSVHIYKKHKAQYELRTYFTFVQFKHLTESTSDTLLEYLQRNLPEGVALKTSKIELQKLPDYLES